jgi:hypothetical protein
VSARVAAVIVALLTGVGVGNLTDSAGQTYDLYGGTVRAVGGVWSVVDDAAHEPLGITSATCDPVSGFVTVTLDETAAQVVTSWADTDETLSRLDVQVGGSVGLGSVVLRWTRAGVALPCTSPVLSTANANTWLGGVSLP